MNINDSNYSIATINDAIQMLKESGKLNTKEISDGYHTFGQLYHDRAVLFSVICNTYKDCAWKSRKHEDGSMFKNMFIVGVTTPEGNYTYHYNLGYWDDYHVKELEHAPKWDGHTFEDIDRLESLVYPESKLDTKKIM